MTSTADIEDVAQNTARVLKEEFLAAGFRANVVMLIEPVARLEDADAVLVAGSLWGEDAEDGVESVQRILSKAAKQASERPPDVVTGPASHE